MNLFALVREKRPEEVEKLMPPGGDHEAYRAVDFADSVPTADEAQDVRADDVPHIVRRAEDHFSRKDRIDIKGSQDGNATGRYVLPIPARCAFDREQNRLSPRALIEHLLFQPFARREVTDRLQHAALNLM